MEILTENTSVSLNMIDTKANIMYDETYGHANSENDLKTNRFGVSQNLGKIQTRIRY